MDGDIEVAQPAATNQRGRNSVVECQLPKLNVVGSSPIARFRTHQAKTFSGQI